MEAKRKAAEKATEYAQNGMIIGLGTGSTSKWAIQRLGERIKEGLEIKAVASSIDSEKLAKSMGIPLIDFSEISSIDLTIDGADEVDKECNLIKGGGGALLREKILAYNSKNFIVIVDESKQVDTLGKFPLPVEVVPFAIDFTIKQLKYLGCEATVRKKNGSNFITDNQNLLLDCQFSKITQPAMLNELLHLIPGVVETGLFANSFVTSVITGFSNGEVNERIVKPFVS
ncbi:MAG: ribose-5-phosphate isomerase RpiA [Candidatus Dadabacteria bacterium]